MKKILSGLFAIMLGFAAVPAFAVIDITAVTTGITDAQTAMLSILAALLALAIALFGVTMVYKYVKSHR